MSMKRTLAIVAAAAMMVAQPLSTLAATPGDSLTPQFEINDSTGVSVSVVNPTNTQTTGTTAAPTETTAGTAQTTDTTGSTTVAGTVLPGTTTTTGAAAQTGVPAQTSTAAGTTMNTSTGNKVLPKINPEIETIRPYMTVDGSGDMQADPVLNLIPLATYFLKDAAGNRIDWATTVKNESFAYAADGFTSLTLEHANVGRWYYRTYSAASGWGPWATSKETTPNQGVVSAMQLRVKGYSHKFGTLYYRAVLNDGTVTDWAREGQAVGVIGDSNRYICAIKLAFWRNGVDFPYETAKPLDNSSNEGVVITSEGARYVTGDGRAYTGWGFDGDSNQYYFENGVAVTGWHAIDGYNIYFDEKGVALKDLSGVMGAQSSYAIRINKATRTAYIMAKDSNGKFTIPYKTLMVTTGTDTPLGSFKIYAKYRWHFMHEGCYCQFLSRFNGPYLLHSLLYSSPNHNTLDAINYNYMDDAISGGCIRLKAVDCAWIYNNCPSGTTVTIYNDPWDKGPIEKDAIDQAIPRDQTYDPTDPVVTAQQDAAAKAAEEKAVKEAEAAAAAGQGEPQ